MLSPSGTAASARRHRKASLYSVSSTCVSFCGVFLSYASGLVQGHTSPQTDAVCMVWCRGLTVTPRPAAPALTCRRCWRASAKGLCRRSGDAWTVTRMWWTPAALRPHQTLDRKPLKLTVTTSSQHPEPTASTRRSPVKLLQKVRRAEKPPENSLTALNQSAEFRFCIYTHSLSNLITLYNHQERLTSSI